MFILVVSLFSLFRFRDYNGTVVAFAALVYQQQSKRCKKCRE